MAGRLEDNFAVNTNFIFYRKWRGGGGNIFPDCVDPGFSKFGNQQSEKCLGEYNLKFKDKIHNAK